MKRFQFRLEAVLRLRRHQLHAHRVALGRAGALAASVEQASREAESAARRGGEQELALLEGGLPGVFAGLVRRRRSALHDAKQLAAGQLVQARGRLDAARREADLALQKVRMLERLRERARTAHRREQERREQTELDELGRSRRSRS